MLVDPVQLLPIRTVKATINPATPDRARITLNGPVYWGRARENGDELKTSTIVTVDMERRVATISDEVLGWEPVPATITSEAVPAHPQVGAGLPLLWKGLAVIPAGGPFRVVVREFEEHAADNGDAAEPVTTVRRLVYADTITLPSP